MYTNVEPQNKEKYLANAKNLKQMLEDHLEFVPNMKHWRSEDGEPVDDVGEHTCGTAYCLAGYQAALAGYPKKFIIDGAFIYEYFVESLTGNHVGDEASNFLYHPDWPDSREAALERIQYVIDHNGEYPPRSVWKDFGYNGVVW